MPSTRSRLSIANVDFGVAAEPLGLQLLEVGVGAVAADAVGVEEADAEHEVVDRLRARGRFSRIGIGSPVWNT